MPDWQPGPDDDILTACRYYIEKTGRRVIFEYALVEGVNCEAKHADELARRLRGLQCHVNLIPLNSVKERALVPPNRAVAEACAGGTDALLRLVVGEHVEAVEADGGDLHCFGIRIRWGHSPGYGRRTPHVAAGSTAAGGAG